MKTSNGNRPDFSEPMEMDGTFLNPDHDALDAEAVKQLKALSETARELQYDLIRLRGEGSSLNGCRYTQAKAFGEGGWTGMSITGPRI